jgi:ferredoxin
VKKNIKRNIIEIDKDKCNGCGLCVQACHEGAIEIIDGKARLVSDEYCDGLGDCLPECPTGAIRIVEKDTVAYDEEAVERRKAELKERERKECKPDLPCGCPGTVARLVEKKGQKTGDLYKDEAGNCDCDEAASELRQWPIQLNLINSRAGYLEDADILIAADCTAYAYANFHKRFMRGRITIIGCPKLDDIKYYKEKLTDIFKNNNIRSITVVRMQVPCCSGIVNVVRAAMLDSKTIVPYSEIVITPDGDIV